MRDSSQPDGSGAANRAPSGAIDSSAAGPQAPTITLPKGGGAIKGIGEKFAANPVTGTGSMSVPIATSPGRGGFGPQLALAYDSGAGNGPFGLGWSLSTPAITRKTDKGLPQYFDAEDSDVFLLSGAEDLVPLLVKRNGRWAREELPDRIVGGVAYRIQRYRPRVEGLFARIERWTNTSDRADVFWRSISKDNITTWYGKTTGSRIADPADPQRIFAWLICESYDDKGNVIVYSYQAEDSRNVDLSQANERNRTRTANRYLKRIRYGNHGPYLPELAVERAWPAPPDDAWFFEVVLDYGDHNLADPQPNDDSAWPVRNDPFSSYRSGFELRTYRLCRRALMFHHFPDQPEVGAACLVRSTDFAYSYEQDPADVHNPIFSYLRSATHTSYQRRSPSGYLKKTLPPVEFTYSEAIIHPELRELSGRSLENLPMGIDGASYQWVDLDGEGLSGILSEQAGAWFYKRNLSPVNLVGHNGDAHIEARFGPAELIATQPAASLAAHAQLLDLAGDGRIDLTQFAGATPGFYERTNDAQWEPFVAFESLPVLDWADPNLKFIDLDGDGHADILISEEAAFSWYPSLGEAGFAAARRVGLPWEEQHGPRVIFADGTQSIYLADMSGDGLTDLARIRNGEVCYWPNLGYGRFGAMVTMDNAPWFDILELFDQRRVRLADIDGSGATDILYLGRQGARIYFNQSGNRWSAPTPIDQLPTPDDVASVQALDLLGNGTACLVWSSPLPSDSGRPLRYIELIGEKPHLLTKTINNLGLETEVQYAPSTKFYLQDQLAGRPWITRLPFPVHCVERVTVRDRWRETSFSTTYSYHHGYFDGPEREFRGFGRVEQVDIENYGVFAAGNTSSPYITDDHTLFQPPVKSVTWFHTGALLDQERILSQFAQEYFPNWFEDLQPGQQVLGTFRENHLPEPDLDVIDLSADEWREALRACKGMPLRQEVYELDVDALAQGEHQPVRLFTTAYHNCHIQLIQPRAGNRHAVFHVAESEAITYHYDLDLRAAELRPDPRVAHGLNLKIDEYGNIQQAASVVYPRRAQHDDATLPEDVLTLIRQVQGEPHLAYSETRYTNDVIEPDSYRLRLPCEALTYELTGIGTEDESDQQTPDVIDNRYFTLDELRAFQLSHTYQQAGAPVEALAYHQLANHTVAQKRLVQHTRTLFFADTLDAPLLPLGRLNALALPYESYTLALTDELLAPVFGDKLTNDVRDTLADKPKTGYLSGTALAEAFGDDTAGQCWICSGVAGFHADAAQHFYLPERYTDPFGNTTTLQYDPRDLYVERSSDALGNTTRVSAFDFRVLAPREMQDINGNRSEVRFDVLGMPAAMAVMGGGDTLAGFDQAALNPDLAARIDFFVTRDYNQQTAKSLLRTATARHLYYFGEIEETRPDGTIVIQWGQHPPCAAGIVREQHVAQQPDSPVQTAFEYSDGGGNPLVKKVQAEPEQPGGALRWVASGKTILNNKGNPVKQYEPYFSSPQVGQRFEEPAEVGVTPVIYYDAVGRVIRTEVPDGSYSRVEFSPWHVTSFDQNDTLLEPGNAWLAARNTQAAAPEERRAATLAALHAGTPATTLLDSLGREVIAIAHNRTGPAGAPVDERYVTFTKMDAEGKPLWVQDARKQIVMRYTVPQRPGDDPTVSYYPSYDIAGNLLFQHSMDAGQRWMLNDAAGKPIFAWNSRGFRTRAIYDELHRLLASFVRGTDATNPNREIRVERLIYGEGQANDTDLNLRGKLFEHRDSAGIVRSEAYDFKGNLLHSTRQLAREYKATPDWSTDVALEDKIFRSSTSYDALNRPIEMITPDGSLIRPGYNEAGLLERVAARLRGAAEATTFVSNIDYNAKGQRLLIAYGNGVKTEYEYDDETFRLSRLHTLRGGDSATLQDLRYTYDPVGNIAQIRDDAQDTIFRSNQAVRSGGEYRYDALYRLIAAAGREHQGDGAPVGWDDTPRTLGALPNDGQALRNYVETYAYDAVGNILAMLHHAGRDLAQTGQVLWNRRYQYAQDSNRLLGNSLPGDDANTFSARYDYDAHGNMTAMPHLPLMQWDERDQLRACAKQVVHDGAPETTWYVYDSGGQRVRKITERQNGTRKSERAYLGGFETYREYAGDGTTITLERETLHIMDDKQRIALVETKTRDSQLPTPNSQPLARYQLNNHLGSSMIELNATGQVFSYEEYHPYGSSAYRAGRSGVEASAKRYRYTGKERDEETGLYYHGARYYACWMGRWTAADPIGPEGGMNLYLYGSGNPIVMVDPKGMDTESFLRSFVEPVMNVPAFSATIAVTRHIIEEPAADADIPDDEPETQEYDEGGYPISVARPEETSYNTPNDPDPIEAMFYEARELADQRKRASGEGGAPSYVEEGNAFAETYYSRKFGRSPNVKERAEINKIYSEGHTIIEPEEVCSWCREPDYLAGSVSLGPFSGNLMIDRHFQPYVGGSFDYATIFTTPPKKWGFGASAYGGWLIQNKIPDEADTSSFLQGKSDTVEGGYGLGGGVTVSESRKSAVMLGVRTPGISGGPDRTTKVDVGGWWDSIINKLSPLRGPMVRAPRPISPF